MKVNRIIIGAALGIGTLIITAQDAPRRTPGPRGGSGGGPLLEALDTNKNGELDATEIANAATSLKQLDKNGDGKLSVDELRRQRPGGGEGLGGRPPGGGDR